MPVFKSPQVLDATLLRPRAELGGLSVTIVYPGTSDPVVPLYEYGSGLEIPGAVLTVSDATAQVPYALTPFVTPAGVYEVEALDANGIRSFLETAEGARLAAVEAADAASSSASAAEAAQNAAEQAVSSLDRKLLPEAATNGETVQYNSTSEEWEAVPFPSGGSGDGTVTSVNDLGPDVDGNVQIDYGQVGAAAAVHTHTAAATTSGEFDTARIPNLPASKVASGTLDAARIPGLDASKIAAGTIATARMPQYVQTVNGDAGVVEVEAEDIEAVRNVTPSDLGGIGVVTALPTAGPGKRLFFLIPE